MKTISSMSFRRAPVSRAHVSAILLASLWAGVGGAGCDGASETTTDGTGATGGKGGSGGTTSTGETGGTGGKGGTGGTGGTGGMATGGTGGMATGGTGGTGGSSACEPMCDAVSGIASECVAIIDNSGQTNFGLRMAQLTLTKPAALTNPLVAGIVGSGVTMNLPECNLTGDGTFSWLLELDTTAGTLKTGGAKPVADPTAGYCFIDESLGGTPVKPLVVNAAPDAGGTIDVAVGGDVFVPIFLGNVNSFLLLPLRDLNFTDTVLSADQSCIGSYNADKLLPEDSCEPSGGVTRFTEAGSLDAYITLEDADQIIISALSQSLCVLLTGDAGNGGNPKKCSRDANGQIIAKGDWCSMTNAAGGCMDSMQATGTFAASAVKITGNCP